MDRHEGIKTSDSVIWVSLSNLRDKNYVANYRKGLHIVHEFARYARLGAKFVNHDE